VVAKLDNIHAGRRAIASRSTLFCSGVIGAASARLYSGPKSYTPSPPEAWCSVVRLKEELPAFNFKLLLIGTTLGLLRKGRLEKYGVGLVQQTKIWAYSHGPISLLLLTTI
jgi:hypothetical protein